MATRKKTGKTKKTKSAKKQRVKKNKPQFVFTELKKIVLGLGVLLAVCLTAAMIADILLKPDKLPLKKPILTEPGRIHPETAEKKQPPSAQARKKQKTKGLKEKQGLHESEQSITYEVYKDIPPVVVEKPIKPLTDKTPKIAIIIDDIGYNRRIAMALFDLHHNITFSVLPFSPFGPVLAERLNKKGAQLMLHLPMEPVEYPSANPGPGAILSSMPPDILLEVLKKNIAQVPNIKGANNHMGSELTTHANQMNQIFTILKKENLFFIDSRTAPKSQCKASARLLKLKFAQRDVFLDNIQEDAYIRGQLKELIDLAKKHGSAIGIGHPYPATLETLSRELPRLNGSIKIVRADALTAVPG